MDALPVELLIQIIKNLPDLASWHSFACAAPNVLRLTPRHGVEILEAITSRRTFTTPHVRHLIHMITQLRTTGLPNAWTLDTMMRDSIRPTWWFGQAPKPEGIPPVPVELPFSVLATATQIQNLAHACLTHYLSSLAQVMPRLRKPADPNFNYTGPYGPDDLLVPGHRRQCRGETYALPGVRPPSWIEQQVVLRSLWRFQFFLDLKVACERGRCPGLESPSLPILRLTDLYKVEGYDAHLRYNEIASVAEFATSLLNPSPTVDSVRTLPTVAVSQVQKFLDIPEDEYWSWSKKRACNVPLSYGPRTLQVQAFVDIYAATLLRGELSPLRGAPVALYRRFGIWLWDRDRMTSLGLVGSAEKSSTHWPLDHYWFMWRSLLSPQEIEAEESRLEREHRLREERSL